MSGVCSSTASGARTCYNVTSHWHTPPQSYRTHPGSPYDVRLLSKLGLAWHALIRTVVRSPCVLIYSATRTTSPRATNDCGSSWRRCRYSSAAGIHLLLMLLRHSLGNALLLQHFPPSFLLFLSDQFLVFDEFVSIRAGLHARRKHNRRHVIAHHTLENERQI